MEKDLCAVKAVKQQQRQNETAPHTDQYKHTVTHTHTLMQTHRSETSSKASLWSLFRV